MNYFHVVIVCVKILILIMCGKHLWLFNSNDVVSYYYYGMELTVL